MSPCRNESKRSRDCDVNACFSARETDDVTRVEGELILPINWKWTAGVRSHPFTSDRVRMIGTKKGPKQNPRDGIKFHAEYSINRL